MSETVALEISRKKPVAAAARWPVQDIIELYETPLLDLLYKAQTVHRQHHEANAVQLSSLLSIKTGGCPEDCSYCPQSSRYDTEVEKERLLELEEVLAAAREAQAGGAQRFCMGAAWRSPKAHHIDAVAEMVRAVKAMGLETCVTLGMLKEGQAEQLKDAGLDYYNHNLDTSPEFYGQIITTRTYQDRLDTLERVRHAGINVCCGGIVGLGESRRERAGLIAQLANLNPYPDSVPVNNLVKVEGTPLQDTPDIDPLEFVRTIAVARITMPKAVVRLSAGRDAMSDTMQAMCFMAGANSIFYGDKLLTTGNPQYMADRALFERLGLHPSSEAGHA
ncbi:biotin synthase BioB [Eoetvoesiella caeni]|uniref:Biotin synthase n=1 Tax=Eoetvoesiella caeni TaxID=645616 RepID=A0A366HB88_9BURK|nr:biotin synthase BioB [Eoetvoesiella caeni]MCI2809197.1 biotin synthase BioB [Eoetvoesiella caeni]NYT54339.1 biotin synthase BioB [Eoetvoesiella caeni]RBP39475.1 biotin synthase [Eoetvoesiella caeni]